MADQEQAPEAQGRGAGLLGRLPGRGKSGRDRGGEGPADSSATARGRGAAVDGATARGLARSAGRVLLWAFIALVFVRGVGDIVSNSPEQPAPAASRLEVTFPDLGARGLALRFARAYIGGRPGEVGAFLASGLRQRLAVERSHRRRPAVVQASVAGERRLGADRGLITVTCELSGGRGVRYVAVTVARGNGGGLVIDAPPAFIAGPRPAAGEVEEPDPLSGRGAEPVRKLASRFVRAYLSRGGGLAYLVVPGARVDPVGGKLRLVEVTDVGQLGAAGGGLRTVLARARVRDTATGAVYVAAYRLELVRRDRWYVAGVEGALS